MYLFLLLLMVVLYIAPFLIRGENSIFTVHDNLDDAFAFIQNYKLNNLFWKIDSPTSLLNGVSTLYTCIDFSLYYIIMNYCPTFVGFMINYAIALLVGTFSMYFLLLELNQYNDRLYFVFIAFAYAVLPIYPHAMHTFSFLPLYVLVAIKVWKTEVFNYRYMLLCFMFPFFISFYFFGFCMYIGWALLFIAFFIKNRRINFNILIGGIVQIIGIVLCDIRTVMTAFLGEELNRILYRGKTDLVECITIGIRYFTKGQYHASTISLFIFFIFLIYIFFYKKHNKDINKVDIILFIGIIIFCLIQTLYEYEPIRAIVRYVPVIGGMNWGRVGYASRLIWYVLFANILYALDNIKMKQYILVSISIMQLMIVVLCPVEYNDLIKNIFWNKYIEQEVTYEEFFAEDLFESIKADIGYSNEKVVAYGFHTSVLAYNGFSTIDGYLSYYPLEDYYKFKKIIQPELDIDSTSRQSYEKGGIRRYLFSPELDFRPTRNIPTDSYDLYIDEQELKMQGGKYIISRVKIKNAEDLNIELIGDYTLKASIYHMWVYKVN